MGVGGAGPTHRLEIEPTRATEKRIGGRTGSRETGTAGGATSGMRPAGRLRAAGGVRSTGGLGTAGWVRPAGRHGTGGRPTSGATRTASRTAGWNYSSSY